MNGLGGETGETATTTTVATKGAVALCAGDEMMYACAEYDVDFGLK